MSATNPESFDEICAPHKIAATAACGSALTTVAPYEIVAITHHHAPLDRLYGALGGIRSEHEILSIHVRRGSSGCFERFEEQHFRISACEWVALARRRHPQHMPRVVGMMMAKDEADVIPEVFAGIERTLDALYYSCADEATREAVCASEPRPGWARPVTIPEGQPRRDGLRHFLLDAARADANKEGDPRPTWVFSIQGDEVYESDLGHHVRLAQEERATAMNVRVPTFVLHVSQQVGWDWSQPLKDRLTHCVWGGGEHGGFLDFPWLYYNPTEHMRPHPRGMYLEKYAKDWPVRRHYPLRSPDQARARIADRIESGWQPNYAHYASGDVFVGGAAYGLPVVRYEGTK